MMLRLHVEMTAIFTVIFFFFFSFISLVIGG